MVADRDYWTDHSRVIVAEGYQQWGTGSLLVLYDEVVGPD